MIRNFLMILFCIFYLNVTLAVGQEQLSGAPMLRAAPGAVSTGQGFTGVSSAVGLSSAYWNPAGLGFLDGVQFGYTYFDYLPGENGGGKFSNLATAFKINQFGTLDLHFSYFGMGNGGEFGRSDFNAREFKLGVSYGGLVADGKLGIGFGVSYVNSRLAPPGLLVNNEQTQVGKAVSFDVGILYRPDNFPMGKARVQPSVGFSVTNFGSRLSYSTSDYRGALPMMIRLGYTNTFILDKLGINIVSVSGQISKYAVRYGDGGGKPAFAALFSSWGSYQYDFGGRTVTVPLSKQLLYSVGFEYWYNHLIALRFGYHTQNNIVNMTRLLTFGGSLNYSVCEVNVSYVVSEGSNRIGNTFRAGVMFHF